MKAVAVFAALFTVVLSGPAPERHIRSEEDDGLNMKYFLVEREDGTYVIEDLVNSEVDPRASETDVTYHFYSRSNPSSSTAVKSTNVAALGSTDFSASKLTLFVIHGWTNNYQSPVNTNIRQAALPKYDINLFVVDWSPIAGKNYISAKNAVVEIGRYVAAFIQSLQANHGVQLSSVMLVGHSLGAHVAGNAGAALGGQASYIVGLDPAGPLFSYSNTDNRLDPTDARFVQVIHTNGGLLGLKNSIGDADYFPNGGSSQPGCGLDITGSCAHARAFEFYAESIASSSNRFVSTQCSSYSNFSNGRCSGNLRSVLGGFPVDSSVSGDFFLDTNSASPYAKG